ncbi:uncharacterized protein LOC122510028 [Leptopilina heterotoma]|uniref:uncharacterized protein LOC122510028 n=1 Tax=Leptopilina heterotoma TaxID=63436 RepID=UPI001CA9D9CB|nr:uncharacterized protein LOC122510028 [Leptopilina heterotoma]
MITGYVLHYSVNMKAFNINIFYNNIRALISHNLYIMESGKGKKRQGAIKNMFNKKAVRVSNSGRIITTPKGLLSTSEDEIKNKVPKKKVTVEKSLQDLRDLAKSLRIEKPKEIHRSHHSELQTSSPSCSTDTHPPSKHLILRTTYQIQDEPKINSTSQNLSQNSAKQIVQKTVDTPYMKLLQERNDFKNLTLNEPPIQNAISESQLQAALALINSASVQVETERNSLPQLMILQNAIAPNTLNSNELNESLENLSDEGENNQGFLHKFDFNTVLQRLDNIEEQNRMILNILTEMRSNS